MVRYGILGFGNHGVKRLVPAFAGTKKSRLAGIWRRDLQKSHSQAHGLGIAEAFSSPEALCSSSDIDAVIVTSPDALHMDDTLLALSYGKSVLCEKPAAMNVGQVRRMVDAAHTAGLQFGVAQNFRFNRSVNLIRDWLRQGRIGHPIFAGAQFCFQAGNSPRKWIYDPAIACGGVIGDVGIHCIDALRYVLADEISAVTVLAQRDTESEQLEANAALSAEFAGGTLVSVQVSFRANYRTRLEITGELGTVHADDGLTVDHPVQIVLQKNGEIVDVGTVVNNDAYSLMIDAFSTAIEGCGPYAAPGEDAIRNQMVLDAAFASFRDGARQIVPADL